MPAGHVLFELGSLGREMFVLLQGECAFYARLSNNENTSLEETLAAYAVRQLDLTEIDGALKKKRANFKGVPKATPVHFSHVEIRGGQYCVFHFGRILKRITTFSPVSVLGANNLVSQASQFHSGTAICTKASTFLVVDTAAYQVAARY